MYQRKAEELMKEKTRRIVCSRCDGDDKDERNFYPHGRDCAFEKPVGWNIGAVDRCTALRPIEDLPGFKSCMMYAGACFKLSPCYVENEYLTSISYSFYAENKARYVIPPSHKEAFETLSATEVFC